MRWISFYQSLEAPPPENPESELLLDESELLPQLPQLDELEELDESSLLEEL